MEFPNVQNGSIKWSLVPPEVVHPHPQPFPDNGSWPLQMVTGEDEETLTFRCSPVVSSPAVEYQRSSQVHFPISQPFANDAAMIQSSVLGRQQSRSHLLFGGNSSCRSLLESSVQQVQKSQGEAGTFNVYVGSNALLGGQPLPQPVSIMRFGSLAVDPSNWIRGKMVRDMKRKRVIEPSIPSTSGSMEILRGPGQVLSVKKAGAAGSEFGAELREELHKQKQNRKRRIKEVKKENQPWLLKLSYLDKSDPNLKSGEAAVKSKRYKGTKVGGVDSNASYYVFVEKEEFGEVVYEAFPVDNWFDFKPVQCFKSLTSKQAEEKFQKRKEILNYFCVMTRKRIAPEKEEEEGKENFKKRALDSSASSSEDDDDEEKVARKKKRKLVRSKLNELVLDDEDDEEQEVEFMSSSEFSSEEENGGNETEDEIGNNQCDGFSSSGETDSEERFGSQE